MEGRTCVISRMIRISQAIQDVLAWRMNEWVSAMGWALRPGSRRGRVARPEVEERVFSWCGLGSSVRASASASCRFGAVLKALAELGLGVPGSAEPQLGVGRGETRICVANLADKRLGFCDWLAALENELVELCRSDHSPEQHSLLRPEPSGFPLHPRKSPRRGAILIVVSAQF